MSRPYRFAPLPVNRGLAVGAGLVQGLNQGVQNLARIRMQRAQMEAHKMQAQAMNTWRQSQADASAARTAGVNTAKVHAAYLMDKYGITDGMTEKAINETLLKNKDATPQDVSAITNWAHQQALAGGPMMPPLNMNEAKAFTREGTDQSRQNIASTQAGARVTAAGLGADSRVTAAGIGAKAKVTAAGISASARPGGKASSDNQELKDSNARMLGIQKSIDALNKPAPMGSTPMDPGVQKTLMDKYQNDLAQEHQHYQSIVDRIHGNAAAPQAPAQPKYLPTEQWSQAQPGDYVAHQGGGYAKALGNGQFEKANGQTVIYPDPTKPMTQPQTPAGQPPAPSSAVPGMPQITIGALPGTAPPPPMAPPAPIPGQQ